MTHTHRPTTPKTKTLRLRKIVLIVIIFVAIGGQFSAYYSPTSPSNGNRLRHRPAITPLLQFKRPFPKHVVGDVIMSGVQIKN